MNPIATFRAAMLDKLTAAAVAGATGDPVAVAPFVLVGGWTPTAAEGVGGWRGTVAVTVAVPPPGDAVALAALEEQLVAVYGALGFAPARLGSYSTGDGTATVPAYHLTYPALVPNPNC